MKRQLAVLMMIGCLVLSGCTFGGNVSETPDDDSTVGDQRTEQPKDQSNHKEEEKANEQRGVMKIDCGSQEEATPQTPECPGDMDDGGDSQTQTDEPEDTPSADETPSPDTETPDDTSPQTEESPTADDGNETLPSTDDGSETTPPTDDGNKSSPPTDDGNESTPPTDDGNETTPPTDDGNETTPPTDDGNETSPPADDSNQTVESPIDGGTARLATVTEVIDGDTVTVEFQNGSVATVQLIGVDAPEMLTLATSPEKYGIPDTPDGREWLAKYGNKSKTFAENELAGQTVVVVTDTQSERGSYIYYGNGYDTSFQQKLLEQGYARVYTDATFVMKEKFIGIETTAKKNNVGLWGYESSRENETPKNETPENNDTSTDDILESAIPTNTTLTNGIATNKTLNNGTLTNEILKSETPKNETSTPRTDEP